HMFGILTDVAEQALASVEVPLERLKVQICEAAAHLAAGVGRWLLLVGEFDERKGYERWECRSTTFWLNWHCGISVRTAREHVRLGRALLDYPRIAEPLRATVSNADAFVLMVETMLGADHNKDISRHERTMVVVHLDPDKAHLHEGPNISTETAKRMSCDACVCGVLMRENLEILDLG